MVVVEVVIVIVVVCVLSVVADEAVSFHLSQHRKVDFKHKALCKWIQAEFAKDETLHSSPDARLKRKRRLIVAYWTRQADKGDTTAQLCVGSCHFTGDGVDGVDIESGMRKRTNMHV
jgi:hypothetical protein